MNGFTLGGTGHQPQQNAAGVIWWDDVQVFRAREHHGGTEGARTDACLARERLKHWARLEKVDLGEQLLRTPTN